MYVCENRLEFDNPIHNPNILVASNLALKEQNFLLTEP